MAKEEPSKIPPKAPLTEAPKTVSKDDAILSELKKLNEAIAFSNLMNLLNMYKRQIGNLSALSLQNVSLPGVNMRGYNLYKTDFSGADLRGANLSDTNMQGVNLQYADLTDAELSGADLRGANLIDAIYGKNMQDARTK